MKGLQRLAELGDPIAVGVIERQQRAALMQLSEYDEMQLRYHSRMNHFRIHDEKGNEYPIEMYMSMLESLEIQRLILFDEYRARFFLTALGWEYIKQHDLYKDATTK